MNTDFTPVCVIVPVFRNLAATQRCIESVLNSETGPRSRLIVIDDASPEPEVSSWCDQLAEREGVTVLRNPTNCGFVATVNRGIEESGDTDVLLLNSDTEVANDWLLRLQNCAYSDTTIGTVTPLSNNASVCSYPIPLRENPLPDGWTVAALDALAAQVNQGKSLELPTAVGFCMYIRRDCLESVGIFDEENFGIGYGEECDFSMRAKSAGWINALCPAVFVYHEGGQSFTHQTQDRIGAAEDTLRRIHPQYHVLATAFIDSDPIRFFRDALDQGRLERSPGDAPAIASGLIDLRDSLIESKSNREMGLEHAFVEVKAESATLSASLEETRVAKAEVEEAHGLTQQKLRDALQELQNTQENLHATMITLEQTQSELNDTRESLNKTQQALYPLQARDGRWRYLIYLINRLEALYLRISASRSQS